MDGAVEYMTEVGATVGITAKKFDFTQANTFVDVLNKFQSSNWAELSAKYPFIHTNPIMFPRGMNFLGSLRSIIELRQFLKN